MREISLINGNLTHYTNWRKWGGILIIFTEYFCTETSPHPQRVWFMAFYGCNWFQILKELRADFNEYIVTYYIGIFHPPLIHVIINCAYWCNSLKSPIHPMSSQKHIRLEKWHGLHEKFNLQKKFFAFFAKTFCRCYLIISIYSM